MEQVLPPEIVTEILIRTDIEILPRLRCVCKEWRRLFSDPYFINQHHQKSKNVRGFIFDCTFEIRGFGMWVETSINRDVYFFPLPNTIPSSEPLPSLTFMLEPVRILASTLHGLLLCFGLVNKVYYVCKPTTQEWAALPSPDSQNETVRMVLSVASASPLRFRVMRVSVRRTSVYMSEYKCEVFDSDSCGVWKIIDSVRSLFGGQVSTRNVSDEGVDLDGSFFWFERKGRGFEITRIVCFNMWTEEVTTLKLPEGMINDRDSIGSHLFDLNGRLGLLSRNRHLVNLEYWAIANMGEGKWEKLEIMEETSEILQVLKVSTIDGSLANNKYRYMPRYFTGGKIVFTNPSKSRKDIHWCEFNEKFDTGDGFQRLQRDITSTYLYFFKSDYFPCNIDGCPYNK